MTPAGGSLHAVAFLLGETGILVTGTSGAGKSSLVAGVAALWRRDPVRLVADDRVLVTAAGGRLVARAPAGFTGRIEIRGVGIVDCPAMPSAVLRALVVLEPALPARLPEPEEEREHLFGVSLPVMRLLQGPDAAAIFLTKWPYFHAMRVVV